MKGHLENPLGDVNISTDAISAYAGTAALECSGVVGMAEISLADGLVKLLSGRSAHKGIQVKIDVNEIFIDLHIIIAYGVNILAVSNNLISTVKYMVEQFTGMVVREVNVYVEGVRQLSSGGQN